MIRTTNLDFMALRRIITGFSQVFVGVLFIISGLIKLNDPVGFSFKLQDYFAPEVLDLDFLSPYALMLAVMVVLVEVILGVMLLLGYAKKLTLWSLMGMIVFFTFLTFYSAYFNKVTDCGCFGDALKLTPWESFTKDVVLLVLIAWLIWQESLLYTAGTQLMRSGLVLLATIASLAFGYEVLMHLPTVDFRPYKIGANIALGMSVPADAPPPIIEYRWQFEGPEGSFELVNTTGRTPAAQGAELIGVETEFIRPPYEPPIHDFSMERDGVDYTAEFLQTPKLLIVVAYNLAVSEATGLAVLNQTVSLARAAGYRVIGLSSSGKEEVNQYKAQFGLNLDFYFCDMTTLKTIVRSNPGLITLQSGTITQKVHWGDAKELKFN